MNDQVKAIATLTFCTPVEGGFFAGYINMQDGVYGIAVASKAEGELRGEWGKRGTDVAGARSYFDCRANTLAMAEAGSELAQKVLALRTGGCDDWSIPSRDVLELVYRNLKPTNAKNYGHRSGDNPSSVPAGYPYTEALPGQTAATAFQGGGVEALSPEWYWTSTQFSGAYAWVQHFDIGYQDYRCKGREFLCRAVRRFKA